MADRNDVTIYKMVVCGDVIISTLKNSKGIFFNVIFKG